jgi:hypothetical protein
MEEFREQDSPLIKFFNQYGPLGATLLAVTFNFIILIYELLWVPEEPNTWRIYAGTAGAGGLIFFIALIVIYHYQNSEQNAYSFRVLLAENHCEIEDKTDSTVNIIVRQKLIIKALRNNQEEFRLFHPLEKYMPSKFEFPEGKPEKLDRVNIANAIENDEFHGVGIYFPNRKFIKGRKEVINVTWTYENVLREKGVMAAIIRRPTSNLKLSASVPSISRKIKKTGWEMYNLERHSIKAGKARCDNFGNKCIITKTFTKINEGFGYTLWWDY